MSDSITSTASFSGHLKDYGVGVKTSSSGFYYNNQLRNELQCVSLHPNSEFIGGKWEQAAGPLDSEDYRIKPIARAILSEDYQIAVANTWSQFGDDEIGKAWNNIKPFAPYAGHLAKMTGEMMNKMGEMEISENKAVNSTIANGLKKVVGEIQNLSEKGAKVLNRSLVAQGARFSYYSGTGIGFGNLSMKFTIFADFIDDKEDLGYNKSSNSSSVSVGNVSFKTVDDQLKELYPYTMGEYTQGVVNSNGEIEGTQGTDGQNIKTGITGDAGEIINEFLAWELPPGGYEPDTKSIDTIQKGTLKLKFGAFYSLPNLVIVGSQFNFSRQMVKFWDGSKNTLTPLYCDVVLNFKPVTKFSDDSLKRFISGYSMQQERASVNNALKEMIEYRKSDNKIFLGGY